LRRRSKQDRAGAATGIAFDLGATVSDTLYPALAEQRGAPLVTADRKLHDKAKGSARFAGLVVWLAEPPPATAA
jgi:predicted nucleic acid-binding protein